MIMRLQCSQNVFSQSFFRPHYQFWYPKKQIGATFLFCRSLVHTTFSNLMPYQENWIFYLLCIYPVQSLLSIVMSFKVNQSCFLLCICLVQTLSSISVHALISRNQLFSALHMHTALSIFESFEAHWVLFSVLQMLCEYLVLGLFGSAYALCRPSYLLWYLFFSVYAMCRPCYKS